MTLAGLSLPRATVLTVKGSQAHLLPRVSASLQGALPAASGAWLRSGTQQALNKRWLRGDRRELPGCHDRAVLLYEYVGKRIVDLQHTEVPDAYRGRGIAKHLAKAALDFVVEEDLKAHLTCWYIQKYVKENPLPQYLERLQP